jgi:hypothetical protein
MLLANERVWVCVGVSVCVRVCPCVSVCVRVCGCMAGSLCICSCWLLGCLVDDSLSGDDNCFIVVSGDLEVDSCVCGVNWSCVYACVYVCVCVCALLCMF